MADYFVYILTNKPRGTLYVGVTNDLVRRIYEHREGVVPGFTKTYGLKQLVHFENTTRRRWPFSARKTSNTGRAYGSLISSIRLILSGGTFIPMSPAERPHGCPGQARARRSACCALGEPIHRPISVAEVPGAGQHHRHVVIV